MALEGSLRDFGLADILQLIFFQRKTGVLSLESKLDKIRLLFIEGYVVGAESKRRMEARRLGKVLVKKGFFLEEDLQSLLEEQQKSNQKLGSFLIRKGLLKRKDVEEILTGQIKETVIQLFNWKEGTYEFTPQAIPVDEDVPISIDTQHLLMEGLRIVDEWTLIEGRITLDIVFRKHSDDVSKLSAEELEILSFVDGDSDVSTIIDISGKDDFAVSRVLVSLLEKGVIEPVEAAPVISEVQTVQAKKISVYYRYLPVTAIVVAVILSLFSFFIESGTVIREFRASQAVDEMRLRIAAYKFAHKTYPAELYTISTNADPWGNPYIYRHADNYFLILSSGPDGREGTPDDIY